MHISVWIDRLRRIAVEVLVLALVSGMVVYAQSESQESSVPKSDNVLAESSNGLDNFCSDAQQFIANTNLEADNTLYDEWQAYVSSKPLVDEERLLSQQYILYDAFPTTKKRYAKLVSCKFKSSDRINMIRGDGNAGEERSCGDINRQTIERVASELGADQTRTLTVEPDDSVFMGPQWLDPWPYEAISQAEDGSLRVTAKEMHIVYSKLIPMPDRFKGVHYCHLVAPDYVRALMTGTLEPAS